MIHKGFLFNTLGGMPFNQQRLEHMQNAYSDISASIASLIGDNVIVSGCIITGNNVSDGWIVVNNELLPFGGGEMFDTLIVREVATPLIFKNGASNAVVFSRFAQFGTGDNPIEWASMRRMHSLIDISIHTDNTSNPHGTTKAQIGLGNIPNAITDDITVSDSGILATSKMASQLMFDKFGMSGHSLLDQGVNTFSLSIVPRELDLKEYLLVADIYEYTPGSFFAFGTYHSELLIDRYFTLIVTSQGRSTSLHITYNNTAMLPDKSYHFAYQLIKI